MALAMSPPAMLANPAPGHVDVKPAGRFCGSARMSKVAVVLPQIFQVAREFRNFSKNQAFCSAPRIVCGGPFLRGFGISTLPKRSTSGGLPELYLRPASRI